MTAIGVIGVGRLGLCLALNLENAGYSVFGVDSNVKYVASIQDKSFHSYEKGVNKMLKTAKNCMFSTDLSLILQPTIKTIFICVATPSLTDGTFNHSYIDSICDELLKFPKLDRGKNLVICSTVMPGYTNRVNEKLKNHGYAVSYNPSFIAQGTILNDLRTPDQVLIGEASAAAGDEIMQIHQSFCSMQPAFNRMSPTEAEITKLSVNCFLTTKIAFANSIGDLTTEYGGNKNKVLNAIGSDSRIGNQFLNYGFGYGGPCLPRDNRAMQKVAQKVDYNLPISKATDQANTLHRQFQSEQFAQLNTKEDQIIFEVLSYKADSDSIEESQKLAVAIELANKGYQILLKDRVEVISQIKTNFGDLFSYEIIK